MSSRLIRASKATQRDNQSNTSHTTPSYLNRQPTSQPTYNPTNPMQGDIFQLESLTARVAVPKPQTTAAPRPKTGPQVAIYNEDDLSHLLYTSHHHHHHHHNHHEHRPFTHPADDAGMVFINTPANGTGANTPALSDCESCCGSETSGLDVEGPMTPPYEAAADNAALDEYYHMGRRNAVCLKFEDGFTFPVFLGAQDEEWRPRDALAAASLTLAAPALPAAKATEVEVPRPQHVDAIGGSVMSWWPEPLDTMKDDWAVESLAWELQAEKEKLREREREGGLACAGKGVRREYGTEHVADIEGPMMSWWPAPLESAEYDWSERFYE
ncbi:hypothetical protein F4802DRAFT_598354 [Xylaria palmicola]|nr:hypothetical protein F4802DRAFT_598354 [Xylaria palmicola]